MILCNFVKEKALNTQNMYYLYPKPAFGFDLGAPFKAVMYKFKLFFPKKKEIVSANLHDLFSFRTFAISSTQNNVWWRFQAIESRWTK